MNSIKCNQCGLTNWATAENCKKCKSSLKNILPSTELKLKPRTSIPIPTLSQTLKNDYVSLIVSIIPPIVLGITVIAPAFGISFRGRRSIVVGAVSEQSSFDAVGFGIALIVTVSAYLYLFKRVNSIKNIFKTGDQIVGKITDISFFKDRGRIEYTYSYQRQTFQSGTAIMKTSKTESFLTGQELLLVVDSANPNKALIQDLYT
jgi:hypothetical protein